MPTDDPLAAGIERFIAQGEAQGWAKATSINYRHFLSGLVAQLRHRGCARWTDVHPSDLDACVERWAADDRAASSRLRGTVALRTFCRWLTDHGLALRNPARSLTLPQGGEADLLAPPLSEADVADLLSGLPRLSVFDLRNAALLDLLYGCGLRISEAMALDLSDLDLDRHTVLVRESKHAQTRLVPLPSTTQAAVEDYLALRRTLLRGPDRGALFLTQYGKRWVRAGVYNLFNALNDQRPEEAQRLHPHLLRHSIAVHLLRGGADIRYIQAFLGHAHLDTTKVYLRLVPGHLKTDYEMAMPDIEVNQKALY